MIYRIFILLVIIPCLLAQDIVFPGPVNGYTEIHVSIEKLFE